MGSYCQPPPSAMLRAPHALRTRLEGSQQRQQSVHFVSATHFVCWGWLALGDILPPDPLRATSPFGRRRRGSPTPPSTRAYGFAGASLPGEAGPGPDPVFGRYIADSGNHEGIQSPSAPRESDGIHQATSRLTVPVLKHRKSVDKSTYL